MRAEFVDVVAARLHEPLGLAGDPIPPLAAPPGLAVDQDFVSIPRVGLQSRQPAVIRGFADSGRRQLAAHRVDVDAGRPVGRRPRADAVAARWVHVAQVVILDQLPPAA